jgi:hypothetical protein
MAWKGDDTKKKTIPMWLKGPLSLSNSFYSIVGMLGKEHAFIQISAYMWNIEQQK